MSSNTEAVSSRGRSALVCASISLAVLVLAGCSAGSPSTVTPSPTASRSGEATIPDGLRTVLVDVCVEGTQIGSVEFGEAKAKVGQRVADGRWLIVVPVEFEALRTGEQRCIVVERDGTLNRAYVEASTAWPDGEFERWLAASDLWYED